MAGCAVLAACAGGPAASPAAPPGLKTEQMLIVDCLLPGQVRKLGAFATGVSPRRPQRLPAIECETAGGEYALAARDPKAALNIWLPFAERGEAEAQTRVGELYERGIGSVADPSTAAHWYQRAAEQGDARAMVNLAALYERGQGVARDPAAAARLFRRASGLRSAPARLSIQLIEPMIVLPTAGAGDEAPIVRLRGGAERPGLTGKVSADAGVRGLLVNEQPVSVDANGFFRAPLDLSRGPRELRITATDQLGNTTTTTFTAVAGEGAVPRESRAAAPNWQLGEFHALIIANANYRHLERLNTPANDAQDLKALLERRFGFKTTVLIDATRRDIFAAFNSLRGRVGPRDNVLVFYAGHGEMDPLTQQGYWVPVDGERDNPSNWVSVPDVTDQLSALSARQVLVVADSCYSGTLARSALPAPEAEATPAARLEGLKTLSQLRARVVLTSGGLEPVVDGGAGRNSIFARSLLDVLSAVGAPIQARRVHEEVAARFALRAQRLRLNQRPDYAAIRFAGHEEGDFLFVPKP